MKYVKDIELNAGGLIGALVCGGNAVAFAFSNFIPENKGRIPTALIVIAVCGGAYAGNFLWGLAFKKQD